MDTIDIEDLANDFKESFVSHFTNMAMGAITPALGIFGFLAPLIKEFVEWLITLIGTQGGLIAFMFNTNVFTTDQASDWMKEVQEAKKLPDDVSDDVWEESERRRNHAFKNLVNYRK